MIKLSGDLASASAIRQAARTAMRALAQVAYGPDRAPASHRRWQGWAATTLAALGAAMTVLAVIGLVAALQRQGPVPAQPRSLSAALPQILVSVPAELAPLLLAARFPLLAWRLGYLCVLLLPLVPGQSQVDPAQVAVLLIVFAVAGLRYSRPVLWCMWALMLIPAWLWIGPGWHKPAVATLLLTAGTAGLDLAGGMAARPACPGRRSRTRRARANPPRRAGRTRPHRPGHA